MRRIDGRKGLSILLFCALLFACANIAAAASPITLMTKPVLLGQMDCSCFPILVTAQNLGPDTQGEVTIQATGVTLHYPLQLPHGSVKSFIAYPPSYADYEPLQITLSTSNGNASERFSNPVSLNGDREVVIITDNPGSASFLKGKITESSENVNDVYGSPKILPERGAAYGYTSAVILGDGAERMSDAAVRALKEYVLGGGMLVFFGGSAPQVARDPRWADICPVRILDTQTVNSLPVDTKAQTVQLGALPFNPNSKRHPLNGEQTTLQGPISIARGQPVPGAVETSRPGYLQTVDKPYGCGTVVYCGADPFEGAFAASSDRGSIIRSILCISRAFRRVETGAIEEELAQSVGGNPDYDFTYSSSGGPPTAMPSGYPMNDPFHVKLPAVGTILLILLGYFVLVAPLNLLILRKIGKGQWAWVTAPAISVGFAFIFFRFASGLYSATESKQVFTTLIGDVQGGPTVTNGYAQLFFPRGGIYDLKLSNVEGLIGGDEANPYTNPRPFGSRAVEKAVDAVDQGEVQIPQLETTNLSFQQMRFWGMDPGSKWLNANVKFQNGHVQGRLTNISPYPITSSRIEAAGRIYLVGDIAAGQTKDIDSGGTVESNQFGSQSIFLSGDRMLFIGRVSGFGSGPQIGSQTSDSITKLVLNLGGIN